MDREKSADKTVDSTKTNSTTWYKTRWYKTYTKHGINSMSQKEK